jgi:glutamate-1-semialdehyde aminotransferase/aryl carrier-like protein
MAATRKDRILHRLTGIIQEMSGLSDEAVDPGESFLDLGFDSLFLTQANLRFRREFKVKITFRQLFEEAPCLDALAEYLDERLPEDALPPEPEPAAAAPPEPGSASATAPLPATAAHPPAPRPLELPEGSGGAVDLMRAVALQNQTNAALLKAIAQQMGNGGAGPAAAPHAPPAGSALAGDGAVRAPSGAGASPGTGGVERASDEDDGTVRPGRHGEAEGTRAAGSRSGPGTPSSEAPSEERRAKALGPYKPVEYGAGGLDAEAQAALDDFCAAYAERTRKSKELADRQRPVLSDARSISGFRRDWKEIVYQIAAGKGSEGVRVWDLDGNEYIDMTSSFGISLFGHSPDWAVEAAKRQVEAGFELGTLSPLAEEAARMIRELTGMDRSTFTNTGSEALAAAVRAARTTTAKDRIAVFYDEYHGIGDELLVNCLDTPQGRRTVPTSPGIPDFIVENVLVLKWDDEDFLGTIREHADELAAVIIEPVQNRNPSLKTAKHFQAIREVTREHNIALIFDEMITGFRLAPGGAQEYFGVEVDIACYGKIPSGGLPLAIVSGRGSYLDCFDGGPWTFGDDSFPEAGVTFFGGTFTRHPVSLATCHAALTAVRDAGPGMYEELNRTSRRFAHRLNEILIGSGYPARVEHCESILNLKWDDANPFSRLIIWQLRHRGVLIYDRPFFMTTAHTEEDLDFVVEAFRESVEFLQSSGIVPATAIDGDVRGPRTLPFNQSQTEIWLATRLSPEASRAFHEQVIYELEGPVESAALRHAVQRVVHRHEGLRARENPEAEGWIIDPARHVPVVEVDLTEVPEDRRDEELARRIEADIGADFDLVSGPLIRFTLFRTGEERSTLVVTAHHMAVDGWSMGIVLSDLARYYRAARRMERFGEPATDTLTVFVAEEAEYLASEQYRETQEFWVSQYRDSLPEPLQLPLDRPRPGSMGYHGGRQGIRFDPELVRRLEAFCSGRRVTTFITLYSAFTALMAHLTGQEDVVVGVPMAGQAASGRFGLVGHAVNFLPFRTRVDLHRSFQDLLLDTREYVLDVNDHQRYTYAALLRQLRVRRAPDQVPLVSVMFNVDQGMESFDFDGVEARFRTSPRRFVKHDLFVNVVMEEEAPILEVDHSSDVLDEETVRGWVDLYFRLLESVVADPTRSSAAHLEALTRGEVAAVSR